MSQAADPVPTGAQEAGAHGAATQGTRAEATSAQTPSTHALPTGPIAPLAGLTTFGDPDAAACVDGVCAVPEQDG